MSTSYFSIRLYHSIFFSMY